MPGQPGGWLGRLFGRRPAADEPPPVPPPKVEAAQPAAAEPQTAEAWFYQGRTLEQAERWREAIACYDRALELEPRGAPAWANKGVALVYLGRFHEALACLEEAQRLGLPQVADAITLCRQKLREQAELAAAVAGLPLPTDGNAPPAVRVRPEIPEAPSPTDGRAPEIRVFISSTFRDLQAEREQLIKRVFPELRRVCRERGVEFTEIDLRWGVTEEQASQGKVIQICLDEIARCRPYFIGIIGGRYGWTPSPEDLARDPELLQTYPWVEQAVAAGRSVTEMEILHGVLENPAMAEHALFYFTAAAPGTEADAESTKLADLKARIRASGFPLREPVPDVESLGRLVREDLIGVIDRRYPAHLGPTPLQRERRAHEAFAASRRRAYVEDEALLERLDAHVAGLGPALVVSGQSGLGKSALLAAWSERHRRRQPRAFVVEHYLGAGAADADHLGLLRRVMEEIRARYQLDEAVPTTPEQIEQEFPGWLGRLGEPLVLVVDALDQLAGDAQGRSVHLAWLPTHFPPGVRLIVSTLEGPALDALRRRDWPELAVQPLTVERREVLIVRYLAEYQKALSEAQRRRLSEAGQCANPLYLRTLLEELRVFGTFEQLDARLDHYLAAPDPDDLFRRVLERMEGDYGADLLREVMAPLWAARRGLAESELLELSGLSRLDLSTVLLALDYHLLRREGLLAFFHDYLRRAVEARYLPEPPQQAAAHLRLADYFDQQPPGSRRTDELPWQLQRAAAWERLRDCLADLSDDHSTTLALLATYNTYELLGYWLALGDRYDPADTYLESLARYEAVEPDPSALVQRLNQLGQFLRHAGRYAAAEELFRRALARTEQVSGAESAETATALHNLALARQAEGHRAEAEQLARRALAIREQVLGLEHLETSTSLNILASLLRERGDYAAAEPLFRRALLIRERALGSDDAASGTIANNLAALLGHRGDYAGAEVLFRRVVAICERVLGPDHPETARGLANLGFLVYQRGRLDDAEPSLRRALAIRERSLGPDHPDTAHSLDTLASLLRARADYAGAEPLLRRALVIREQTLGPDHPDTGQSAYNLALLLGQRGDLDGAEALFRRALAIQERALGPEHPLIAATLDSLGGLLDDRGDYLGAGLLYRRALAIRERALGPDHPDTAMTLSNLGYLLVKDGNLAEAESHLRRALAIREQALGPEHSDTAVTLNNLAGVLHQRGDYPGAAALLRRSLAICERALGSGHPSTEQIRQSLAAVEEYLGR